MVDTTDTFVIFTDQAHANKIQKLSAKFEVIPVNIKHYSFAEQFAFPFVLRKARLDLVHFPHFNAPIFSRIPAVVTIHDLILSFYPGRSIGSSLKRRAYEFTLRSITKRARNIITVSNYTKKDLTTLLDLSEDNIEAIHLGADPAFYDRASVESIDDVRKKFNITGEYLMTLGLHREHKNLPRLVRAFARVVAMGYEGQLVLVGKEDMRSHEVRDSIISLGLRNKVILTGFVDDADIAPLLQGASLYIMPSLYEGFGLPILEAMAGQVPVAVAKATSLPEVAGDAAEYFHPLREDEMAETLYRIASDKKLQADLIAR